MQMARMGMWVLWAGITIAPALARNTEAVFSLTQHAAHFPTPEHPHPLHWVQDILPSLRRTVHLASVNRIEVRCSQISGFLPNREGRRYPHYVQTEWRELGRPLGEFLVDVRSRVYVVEGEGASIEKLREYWASTQQTEGSVRRAICPGSEAVARFGIALVGRNASDYSGLNPSEPIQDRDLSFHVRRLLPTGWGLTRTDTESARVRIPFQLNSPMPDRGCAQGVTEGASRTQRRVFDQAFSVNQNPLNGLARVHFCNGLRAREAHNAGFQCLPMFADRFSRLLANFTANSTSVVMDLAAVSDFCAAGFSLSPRAFVAAARTLSCTQFAGLRAALHPAAGDFGSSAPSAFAMLRATRADAWVGDGVRIACGREPSVTPTLPSEGSVASTRVVARRTIDPSSDGVITGVRISERQSTCPDAPVPGATSADLSNMDPQLSSRVASRAQQWRYRFESACAIQHPYIAPRAALADTDIYRVRRYLCGLALAKRQGFTHMHLSLEQVFSMTSARVMRRERLQELGALSSGESCADYNQTR